MWTSHPAGIESATAHAVLDASLNKPHIHIIAKAIIQSKRRCVFFCRSFSFLFLIYSLAISLVVRISFGSSIEIHCNFSRRGCLPARPLKQSQYKNTKSQYTMFTFKKKQKKRTKLKSIQTEKKTRKQTETKEQIRQTVHKAQLTVGSSTAEIKNNNNKSYTKFAFNTSFTFTYLGKTEENTRWHVVLIAISNDHRCWIPEFARIPQTQSLRLYPG